MFDKKLHRRAAANIDFRCGEKIKKLFGHVFPVPFLETYELGCVTNASVRWLDSALARG